jgi:hypothetical protein
MPPRAEFSPMTPRRRIEDRYFCLRHAAVFHCFLSPPFLLTGYFLHADSAAERRFLLQIDYASALVFGYFAADCFQLYADFMMLFADFFAAATFFARLMLTHYFHFLFSFALAITFAIISHFRHRCFAAAWLPPRLIKSRLRQPPLADDIAAITPGR